MRPRSGLEVVSRQDSAKQERRILSRRERAARFVTENPASATAALLGAGLLSALVLRGAGESAHCDDESSLRIFVHTPGEGTARIADLAADSKGAPVADALRKRLRESITAATVNGAPMYGPAEFLDAHIKKMVERLKQKKRFKKPEVADHRTLGSFIQEFLRLPTDKRVDHMRTYGPMCLWDVSHVQRFYNACAAKLLTASPRTFLTFNSDLFWDTSAATNMTTMFANNSEFRGDLSTWDVRNVTKMTATFSGAGITDSGIGIWDVRSLEDATRMFANTPLLSPNLDFSLWNMQNCKNLSFMFFQSAIGDNKIGEWILRSDANTTDMLKDAVSFTGNLPKRHRDAPAVPAMPSFGTTIALHSVRTVAAQRATDKSVRELFAQALSAQGTNQKKEKKQDESICAVQ
jgi:surface protein